MTIDEYNRWWNTRLTVAMTYPRGSEAQIRCLEKIEQDTRQLLEEIRAEKEEVR